MSVLLLDSGCTVKYSLSPWKKSLGLRPRDFPWGEAIFHHISLLSSWYRDSQTWGTGTPCQVLEERGLPFIFLFSDVIWPHKKLMVTHLQIRDRREKYFFVTVSYYFRFLSALFVRVLLILSRFLFVQNTWDITNITVPFVRCDLLSLSEIGS